MSPLRLVVLLLMLSLCVEGRSKTDIIHFKNGDRWTCEILSLQNGSLSVNLDYASDTVVVDWTQVARIESSQSFVIRETDGDVSSGLIHYESPEKFVVKSTKSATDVPRKEIDEIDQDEPRFFRGLNGNADGGLLFNKSAEQTQFTFNGDATYQRQRWAARGEFHSAFSGSFTGPSNVRYNLQLSSWRFLPSGRNFVIGVSDILRSEEQQLDLRSILGGGAGRTLRATSNYRITAMAGLVWTREKYDPEENTLDSARDSAEAMVAANLDVFQFSRANLRVSGRLYPGLTTAGRIRFDTDSTLKFELFSGISWNFNVWANYDRRPPLNLPRSDYGVGSTIGWTF